jgi:hypothetical protein
MEYKDTTSKIILWDLPNDKRLEISDLDSLIQQGFDPYDTESMAKVFRCNVTLETTILETYQIENLESV